MRDSQVYVIISLIAFSISIGSLVFTICRVLMKG
jgi:hypothetical protein